MSFLGRTPSNAPLTSADIPDGIIAAVDLAPNSVDSSELVDGSIDTSHIGDDQVTADKLANSINTAIAANAAKVTNSTSASDLASGTLAKARMPSGTVLQTVNSINSYANDGTGSTTDILSASGTVWEPEITGLLTTSKVLVSVTLRVKGANNSNLDARYQLYVLTSIAGAGYVSKGWWMETGGYDYGGSGMWLNQFLAYNYLQPATGDTSLKVKTQIGNNGQGGNFSWSVNTGTGPSSITIQEIAA